MKKYSSPFENKRYLSAMRICFFVALALTLLATAFQTYVTANYFELNVYLYIDGTPPMVLQYTLLTFSLIILAGLLIPTGQPKAGRSKKDAKLEDTEIPAPDAVPVPENQGVIFVSALCGFGLLAASLYKLVCYAANGIGSTIADALALATVFIAIPSAVYFLSLSLKREPYVRSTMIPGFFVLFCAAACFLRCYFDMTNPMNNPLRILRQLSLIAAMLYMLNELRFYAGRPTYRRYMAFGNIAIFTQIVAALPNIILAIVYSFDQGGDIAAYAVELLFAAYIILRQTALLFPRSEASERTAPGSSSESSERSPEHRPPEQNI